MINTRNFYLAKLQNTNGVPEALTASDYLWALDSSSLDVVPTVEEINNCSDIFDQNASVLSTTNVNAKISQYLFSRGSNLEPYFTRFLQAAGFKMTTVNVDVSKNKYVFEPDVTTKQLSLTKYTLNGLTNAIKSEAHSLTFDPKITFDGAKVPQIEFTGNGAYTGQSVVTYNEVPLISKGSYSPSAFLKVAFNMLGLGFLSSKLDISFNQKMEQGIDWTSDYGYGSYNDLSERKIKLSTSIYCDPSNLPLDSMFAGSILPVSLEWGKTGEKIKIEVPNCQIVNVKESSIGQYKAFDLDLIAINNGFTLTVNSDLTAE